MAAGQGATRSRSLKSGKDLATYAVGALLSRLLPARAKAHRDGFTLPVFSTSGIGAQHQGVVDRLLRSYIARAATRYPSTLEEMHRSFWKSQRPGDWFRGSAARHERDAILLRDVLEAVAPLLEKHRVDTLCEFGTGEGFWLENLRKEWPAIPRVVGVDISEAQIRENQARGSGIEFVCADILAWSRAHASPHTLFVTHGGVFEYLAEGALRELLAVFGRSARGSLFFLVEPLDWEVDLATELASRPYGGELSFAHNYPHLFREAGMQILLQDEREMDGFRMLVMVAAG